MSEKSCSPVHFPKPWEGLVPVLPEKEGWCNIYVPKGHPLDPNNPVQKNQTSSINQLEGVTRVLAVLAGTESSELKTQKIAEILGLRTNEFIIVPGNNRDVAQIPSTAQESIETRESIEIG